MFIVVEKSEVSRQDKSLQKNPNELVPRVKRAKYITLYKKKKIPSTSHESILVPVASHPVLLHHIARLLANHNYRRVRIPAHDFRHDGSVGHP